MAASLPVAFAADDYGHWRIDSISAIAGITLPPAKALTVHEGTSSAKPGPESTWILRGVVSNERYVNRVERAQLEAQQEALGRPGSTLAVLIAMRKSPDWWDLTQEERREIFEERSGHIRIGLDALPPVARRLHHSRDLGEPFDFLNWFEFAPAHVQLFDEVLGRLRETEEWRYVDREVEIRLIR